MTNIVFLLFLFIALLSGIYHYSIPLLYSRDETKEEFTLLNKPRCPDILIQKDKHFFLYNSKLEKVPGVNPIQFDNLEQYVEFLQWQRSQGINCPVLFLQRTYDTQGNSVYKVRPSVTEPQGGLPPSTITTPDKYPPQNPNPTLLVDAARNDKPYNENSVPGYDQTSFYVGSTTPLDMMDQHEQHLLHSANAMDANWGGAKYTQSLIDKGAYKGNEVSIRV
jgi:hypothetical protein